MNECMSPLRTQSTRNYTRYSFTFGRKMFFGELKLFWLLDVVIVNVFVVGGGSGVALIN